MAIRNHGGQLEMGPFRRLYGDSDRARAGQLESRVGLREQKDMFGEMDRGRPLAIRSLEKVQ